MALSGIPSINTESNLSVLTSGKRNMEYVLYRGVSHAVVGTDGIYYDDYLSSWTTNKGTASSFAGRGQLLSCRFAPDDIFLDLIMLRRDYESEIIVLPGQYMVEFTDRSELLPAVPVVQYQLPKKLPSVSVTFSQSNLESISSRSSGITIEMLKWICREHNISGYSKLRKADLVQHIYSKMPDLVVG